MSLTVKIDDRAVTGLLRRIERAPVGARKIVAHAGARCVQDHFAAKNSEFYADAARATTGRVQGDDIVVSIDHVGIPLRYFGGTVTPKNGKYLAIPDSDNPQAKNASPRRIGGLHFRRNRGKDSGRLTDSTGRVFYWLVKKTVHKPDPSVLPSDSDFVDAILPEIDHYLENL